MVTGCIVIATLGNEPVADRFFWWACGIPCPSSVRCCFVGLGNGITLPSANAGIVSVRPHLAGSASGLGGAMMIGGGAALSALAGAILSAESGPYPLIIGHAGLLHHRHLCQPLRDQGGAQPCPCRQAMTGEAR
jgi:DHA1 family bicyclomycin/chloramphenicol resistance-like MFS transporter